VQSRLEGGRFRGLRVLGLCDGDAFLILSSVKAELVIYEIIDNSFFLLDINGYSRRLRAGDNLG